MNRASPCKAVLFLALLAVGQAVPADSYRCGRKLIHSGDSTEQVLRLCGPPLRKDRAQESVQLSGRRQQLPVERWFYRKSSRSLEHVVMMYRGRVVAIIVGRR
jgi:hypothetical protein